MKRGALLLLVVVVVLAGWSPSPAAVRKWSVEVGAQGSYANFDNRLEVKNADALGFRLGFVVHPAFEIQALYDTLSTERKGPNLGNSEYSQDFIGLRVMGVFRGAEEARVNPYMIAGGGLVKTKFDSGASGFIARENTSEFGDAGVGLRIHIWKDLNANVEVLIRHLRTLDDTSSNTYVSAGVSWFLGGKK